jgi:hypothetical protein
MNKYLVTIGEVCLERIAEYYIAYTKDSKEELEDNLKFLQEVDEVIVELYDNCREEDEDWEIFQENMGIIRIEDWTEEDGDGCPIIYDER